MSLRLLAAVTVAAVGGAVAVVLVGHDRRNAREAPEPPLPAAPAPAFTVATPQPLEEDAPTARWSAVLVPVRVRDEPSPSAAVRTVLATRTPEGTQNLVLVRARAEDAAGGLWIRIAGPGLPGEADGWVPRRALGAYHAVHTRLVVDLDAYTATLFRGTHRVASFPVGVGVPASPTPRGEFYVRNRLTRYRDAFYGPLAFGTSVRSPYVTDWPDGGFVGIHGTNRPELLPGRVSHGCIRLRNEDIVRLGRLMPVGTPIVIH
jgi:lipoprotein-anchoring transpeptidase ErfK/SrfK